MDVLVQKCQETIAAGFLPENRASIDRVAQYLIKNKTLVIDDLERCLVIQNRILFM